MDLLQKGFWRLTVSALAVTMAVGYCAAATPAGTVINAQAHCTYANSVGVAMPAVNSNTVGVTVSASSAMTCTVDSASKPASPGATVKYLVTVQNTGGAADTYTAAASTTSSGWQAGVFVDANGNGIVDAGELKPSIQTPSVQPNGTYTFTVAMVVPASAGSGATGTATVSVISTSNSTLSKSLTLTTTVQSSAYIRKWVVVGPFAAVGTSPITYDYLIGEANAVPGVSVAGRDWVSCAGTTDTLDLGTLFSGSQNCVAYAGIYVYSDKAQQATLSYIATGTSQVWLDGVSVYTEQSVPADPTQPRKASVQLLAGWNRLLLKLGETTGPWRFSAVFTDGSGTPLTSVRTDTTRQPASALSITNVATTYMDANNATVQWTTNVAASTTVKYASATSGNLIYQNPALSLQHTATLTKLQPGTTYTFTPSGADTFGYGVTGLASSFQTAPAASSVWITNWLLNGAYAPVGYDSMLATDFLYGEANVQPYEGLYTSGHRWLSASINSYGILNFLQSYPLSYNRCAYAHVYIYSPIAQYAALLTGSNDGIRAWLNGQMILNKDLRRNLVTDQDRTSIVLVQGWNRLLVKVSQYDGLWQMCARIVSPSGGALSGLQYRINRP